MYECNESDLGTDDLSDRVVSLKNKIAETNQSGAEVLRPLQKRFARNSAENGRANIGSAENYIQETTKDEKVLIENELGMALLHLIKMGRAAYLDRFGIFFPKLGDKTVTRIVDKQGIIRKEISRTAAFEKCLELTSYHRREYPQIAESQEIATRVHARLPLNLQIKWSSRDIKKMIEGLTRLLKYEVINAGSSSRLSSLGSFYCMHNRQGLSFADWFAGSNIIFEASSSETVSAGPARFFDRPVLVNAWEPLESAFGEPVSKFTIDLSKELPKLGYSLNQAEAPHPSLTEGVKVAVFKRTSPKDEGRDFSLLFCSDGLRGIGLNKSGKQICGSEVTFQLSSKSVEDPQSLLDNLAKWSNRAFVMAWILLIGKSSGRLNLGSGLSCDCPLLEGEKDSRLSAIFSTPFSFLPGEQLGKEGPFYYNNLVGITEDEAELAKTHGVEHLYILLKHKNLSDITNPSRASILNRTELFLQ